MRAVVDVVGDQAGGSGTLAVVAVVGQVATSLLRPAVHEQARRMAAMLAERARMRRRVGLLDNSSVDLVTALQPVWLCGAAVTMLPPAIRRADNLQVIAADADLDLVVASESADRPPRITISALADPADAIRHGRVDIVAGFVTEVGLNPVRRLGHPVQANCRRYLQSKFGSPSPERSVR